MSFGPSKIKEVSKKEKTNSNPLGKRLIRIAKEDFGLQNTFTTGFLLTDGSVVALPFSGHLEIVDTLYKARAQISPSESEDMNKVLSTTTGVELFQELTCAIKTCDRDENDKGKNIGLQLIAPIKPTERQWKVIEETIKYYGHVVLDLTVKYREGDMYRGISTYMANPTIANDYEKLRNDAIIYHDNIPKMLRLRSTFFSSLYVIKFPELKDQVNSIMDRYKETKGLGIQS